MIEVVVVLVPAVVVWWIQFLAVTRDTLGHAMVLHGEPMFC
jgi:hypothetical protein